MGTLILFIVVFAFIHFVITEDIITALIITAVMFGMFGMWDDEEKVADGTGEVEISIDTTKITQDKEMQAILEDIHATGRRIKQKLEEQLAEGMTQQPEPEANPLGEAIAEVVTAPKVVATEVDTSGLKKQYISNSDRSPAKITFGKGEDGQTVGCVQAGDCFKLGTEVTLKRHLDGTVWGCVKGEYCYGLDQ